MGGIELLAAGTLSARVMAPHSLQIGPSQTWGKLDPWAQNLIRRGVGSKTKVEFACGQGGCNMPRIPSVPFLPLFSYPLSTTFLDDKKKRNLAASELRMLLLSLSPIPSRDRTKFGNGTSRQTTISKVLIRFIRFFPVRCMMRISGGGQEKVAWTGDSSGNHATRGPTFTTKYKMP